MTDIEADAADVLLSRAFETFARLARQLAEAEMKYQVAIQRHEDEVADLTLSKDGEVRLKGPW